MKNYLIISAAALLLLAACTKVTPDDTPGKAVSFQVTNTLAGTKADYLPGVDGYDIFHTYAIFHSTDPKNPQQWFMENVGVSAQEGTSNYLWAPESPYYWPKTGSVSFFSYAGTRVPDIYPTPEDFSKMVFHGGEDSDYMVIRGIAESPSAGNTQPLVNGFLPADNILVADPAYRFNETNNGVTTLFHHMLAKVRFQVILDASDSDATTIWHLIVPRQPMLYVPNTGTLEVTYPASEYDYDTPGITQKDEDGNVTYQGVKWTLNKKTDRIQPIYAQEVSVDAQGIEKGEDLIWVAIDKDGKPLFDRECVVIPQPFGELSFNLNFDLSSEYNGVAGLTEHFTVEIPMSTFMENSDTPNDLTWKPNYIYTYRIYVKTNGQITFDPAAENWVSLDSSDLNI